MEAGLETSVAGEAGLREVLTLLRLVRGWVRVTLLRLVRSWTARVKVGFGLRPGSGSGS